jgi:hypothetical protein
LFKLHQNQPSFAEVLQSSLTEQAIGVKFGYYDQGISAGSVPSVEFRVKAVLNHCLERYMAGFV